MACLGTNAALGLTPILASNVPVRLGTEAPFPPDTILDEAGQITGFERDIADEICTRFKLSCTWSNVQFDRLIRGVISGRSDIDLSGMAAKPERMALVNFSDTYKDAQGVHTFYGLLGAPNPGWPDGTPGGAIDEITARWL